MTNQEIINKWWWSLPEDADIQSNGRAEAEGRNFDAVLESQRDNGFQAFAKFCEDYVLSDFDADEAQKRRAEDYEQRLQQERQDIGYYDY